MRALLFALLLMAPLAALPEADWKMADQAYARQAYQPALEAYRRFLRAAKPSDPRRDQAYLRVALCLEQLGESEREREWLEDWLRRARPGLATARGCLMLAPLLKFQNDRQIALYTRAIEILEPRQDGLEELVQAYARRAALQPTLALSERDLRRAMEVDPTARYSGGAFLELARQYRYRGDSRIRALEVLHELGTLRPGTPEGSEAMLEEARLLDDLERYAEALEMVEALARAAPNRPETREALELKKAILAPMVELSGDMLVGSEPVLQLRARNVTQVQLAVYRVDLVELLKSERTLDPARLPVSGQALAEHDLAVQEPHPHAFYEARLPVPMREPGAYLVQARSGGKTAASLLVRSGLRLFSVGGEGAPPMLWLVRSESGEPVERAEVWQAFYSSAPKQDAYDQVRSLRMLESGLVAVDASAHRSLVLVKAGDEYAWAELDPGDTWRREGFVFTDRPYYRPGQKVHFQALLRTGLGGDALRSPAGESFRVRIIDPQGNRLQDNTRVANAAGAVGGEVTLAPEAALGDYRLEVLQGNLTWAHGSFRVEEARRPEIEVQATPEQEHYDAGQPGWITLKARYPSGEPLARAKVSWKVTRLEEPLPGLGRPGLDWFEASRPQAGSGATVARGEGRLDERGQLRFTVGTRLSDAHPEELFRYRVTAEVTDEGKRAATGSGSFLVSTRTAFLQVLSVRAFWQPTDSVELQAEAVDAQGKPLALEGAWTVSRWTKNRFEKVDSGSVGLKAGRGTWSWKAESPGFYRVVLEGRDSQKRPVRSGTTFQVGEEGHMFEYDGVQALPDKELYRCGELAEVVINTRKPGMDVLLLLGNYQAARRMVVHCPGRSTRVQIPIGADLAPSFSLRAVAMQDGSWLEYERVVAAANVPGVLTVKVEALPARQLPSEEGTLAFTISDASGHPVSADLVVTVADASLWEAAGRDPSSLVRRFYGRSHVSSDDSSRPREYLPETALFKSLHTGADGRALLPVPYPGNLTTWKVVARAFTPDSRFGQAVTDVVVSKDLLARLVAPRFLTERDEVTLAVQVQSNFEQSQSATVTLQADGGAPEVSPPQTLLVPGKAQKSAEFPVTVAREGWLVLTALARAPLQSDSVKKKLAVLPHGTPVVETRAGQFQRQATVELSLPPERNPASTRLQINVSATLAGPVVGGLRELLDFPYGCVEQTVSRFVPAACVARALRDLDLKDTDLQRRAPQAVQAGLSRLASFQHADGGWGWWKDDPTDVLMTAYTVWALSQAEKSGVQVSAPMLERARAALRARWDQLPPRELAWTCYALSFSEQAPDAALDKAMGGELGLTERFLLAQALHLQSRPEEARALLGQADAFWVSSSFGPDVEANAAALMAYNLIAPEDDRVTQLARWLVDRRQGNGWGTTRATAMVVLALLDPLKKERKPSGMRYGLFLNGAEVDTRTVAAEDWWKEHSTILKGDQVPGGNLKLELVAQGDVSGSWSTVLRYTPRTESLPPVGGELSVRRRYYRVDKAGRTEPLRSGKVVRAGDELVVVLDLESRSEREYLVLEDYRPAGCEPLGIPTAPGWANVEVRDELTAFFMSRLAAGKSQLSYRLRATVPGRFHAMPARLYPMYQPGLRASSAEMQLGVAR